MYPTNYPPPHPRPSTAHPRQEQRVGRRQSVHHHYHQPPSSASNQSYPPSVPTAYTSAYSQPAGSHLYQQQSYASSQPYQGQQHLPPNQQQHYVQLNVSAEAQWRSYQQNNPGASRPPVGFLPSPSDSQFTTVTSHQEHPQYHRVNLNHGSYPNNNNTPTMNSPNDPSTFFPILATTQAAMDQSVQTDQQVTAILSLPPTILAKLARTPDIDQQQRILVDSRLDPQILPIMSLSAPEPCPSKTQPANSSTSIGTLATTTSTTPIISQSISQHAIPHILHHVFSPYSNSIFVPVNEPTYPQQNYQPSYRSVDEWAIQVAQQTAASSPIDPEYIAGQLKQWALHSQDTQLEQHVHEAKAHAVLLAAQAEAVIQSAPSPDLTPYANTYKTQLAQVASGYYTELHRAAINQLDPTRTAAGAQPPLPPTPQTAVCPALKTSTSLADPDTSTSTHSTNSCSITSGCDIAVSLSTVTATCNTAPITSSALQSEDNLNAEPTRTATVVHHTDYPSDPSKLSSQFPSESSHHQHQHHHHLPSSFSSTTTPTSAAATTTSTHTLFGSSSAPHLRNGHRPLNMLTSTLTAPSQADNTHSALDKISSQNVQAAAAAALTANFMASTDLASRAGQTLSILGMTVQTKLTTPVPPPGPAAIAATQHSLALAHQQQQQQHHHQLINQSTSAPMMPQNHIHHHHMTSNNHSLPLIPNPAQAHPHSQMISAQRPLSSLPGSLRSPHTSTTMLNTCSSISNPPGASSVIGAHHAAPNEPPNYVSQVERIWRSAQEGQCTERARDYLLSYAHAVYSKKPNDPCLLPLLHTLIKLHPKHLPTLLLLSCVYYSQGDYDSSLFHNDQILILDPEYVEAMSNVGTTKRALGNWVEAEEWWWRAIKLRPTYFDAFDNLLGVLCNPQSPPAAPSINSVQPPSAQPRYDEALRLCTFVETALFGPLDQQNLFYAKGNLLIAMGRASQARQEYEKALEVVCGSPLRKSTPSTSNPSGGYALIDLVLATTSIGIFMMALNGSMSGSIGDPMVLKALSATGIWDPNQCGYQTILADPLKAAHQRRQIIKSKLLQMGGGIIPCVLLLPESLDQLIATVFNATNRVLPVFQNHSPTSSNGESIRNPAFQSANQTTSTVLLTLAKCLQDAISAPMGIGENESSLDGIPPSSSLLLSLYYIAITLHPSASTCNNLGILLSTIPSTLTLNNPSQGRRVINGQQIAHTFYVQGLQKDRNHPHLYTNLGSLLKDMGQLPQAVSMYEKAVQCNPNFDVALANLANAIKDMGRVQESVQWYERAVLINPNFPEAVCGLVNALGGVCDWRDRVLLEVNRWLTKVVNYSVHPPLLQMQLDEGMAYGRGVMRQAASLAQWLEAIAIVKTGRMDGLSEEESKKWRCKFEVFCGSTSQDSRSVTATGTDRYNEGGFLIRLIERCNRQIQRRWYVDTYGKVPYQSLQSQQCYPFTRSLTPNRTRVSANFSSQCPSYLTHHSQPTLDSIIRIPTSTASMSRDRRTLRPTRVGSTEGWICFLGLQQPPLSHLMQSVFGIHNRSQFAVVCYATTASDGSIYRKKIEQEVETFKDVSGWAHNEVIKEILKDRIHILINLNGYTKGAKNEIFAARPCPVQMEFMGFAGTLASGWTDWIIADPVVCPPRMVSGERWRKRHLLSQLESFCSSSDGQEVQANSHASRVAELGREETRMVELVDDGPTDFDGDLDPENMDESWVYTEKFIYMPHSYFVCDHKQGFREELAQDISGGVDLNGVPLNFKHEPLHQALRPLTTHEQPALPKELAGKEAEWEIEEFKRWKMRKEIFPDLDDQTVIFANFNQLYKIDPLIFKYWLEILAAIPNSILWLLRFPAPGEPHLKITAERWAGREVAGRIRFTDVAPKPIHIKRGRIADLFLDSTECNAHTTAADILWSGTPILTLPRPTHAHKMCSRVAASIALATGHGSRMIATSMEDYKERAIQFGRSVRYIPRQQTRTGTGDTCPENLWTRNLESGLWEAWKRFVEGSDSEESAEWKSAGSESSPESLKSAMKSCSIWIQDSDDDLGPDHLDRKMARLERRQFIADEMKNDLDHS
ncbi:hypothetical protein H4Q26_004832 [Puccinia striiformis f. sp. tritici PST-130]|nr:hypothetical protein H4Q26_004832 [Puccinia striiformis f. sp. tritici PST-130]